MKQAQSPEGVRSDSADPRKSHEFRSLCRLAAEASGRYGMLSGGDRVLVGLSGGKDSYMLAHVMQHMRDHAPFDFEFFTATFDPGFASFDASGIAGYASGCGWKHYGVGLPVAELLREKQAEANPCVLCSRLRRGKLSGLAHELNCNKLALGHHLDDVAVSFLMSAARGQGITTMGPNVAADGGRLRLIRPFVLAEESLIKRCAEIFELPLRSRCEYEDYLRESGDRAFFASMIARLEERIPHVRRQLLASLGNIQPEHLFDLRYILK